jgi:hypothetical protein
MYVPIFRRACARAIRLVSHGAVLPRYLRMTCLIIALAAAASENFNVLIHARKAIASLIGVENFHTSEGDIRFASAVVGFSGVGTFLPFILELNGFSRSS